MSGPAWTEEQAAADIDLRAAFEAIEKVLALLLQDSWHERNMKILIAFYGLNGHSPSSQKELAKRYDLSTARIGQIIGRAQRLVASRLLQALAEYREKHV